MFCVDPIKTWAISHEHFIYKPQIGDEDFDCYHLVNLRKGNSTLLIKDCINDPSCMCGFHFHFESLEYLRYLF